MHTSTTSRICSLFPIDKVAEIISKNAKGILPDKLEDFAMTKEQKTEFENGVGQDDLNRFDK